MKSYKDILITSVLCDSMNQATSYWSYVPHHPILFRDWGDGPLTPQLRTLLHNGGEDVESDDGDCNISDND